MCSVHLHKHDVLTVPLTVLLHCPIISMTCTLSYQCSNRAGEIYASLPLTSKEMALMSKLYLKILPSSYYQRTTIRTLCVMVFGFNLILLQFSFIDVTNHNRVHKSFSNLCFLQLLWLLVIPLERVSFGFLTIQWQQDDY